MNPFAAIGLVMFVMLIACLFMAIDTMPRDGLGIPDTPRTGDEPPTGRP
jgi:hypothetical protein